MCLLPSLVESSKVRLSVPAPNRFVSAVKETSTENLQYLQRLGVGGNIRLCPSQGKDEVYDRMLLDYFLSYHKFIHLLCRVAINCEKFTDTLVKLSTCLYFHCYHYSILIKPHEFAQKHRCFHVNALPPSQVC